MEKIKLVLKVAFTVFPNNIIEFMDNNIKKRYRKLTASWLKKNTEYTSIKEYSKYNVTYVIKGIAGTYIEYVTPALNINKQAINSLNKQQHKSLFNFYLKHELTLKDKKELIKLFYSVSLRNKYDIDNYVEALYENYYTEIYDLILKELYQARLEGLTLTQLKELEKIIRFSEEFYTYEDYYGKDPKTYHEYLELLYSNKNLTTHDKECLFIKDIENITNEMDRFIEIQEEAINSLEQETDNSVSTVNFNELIEFAETISFKLIPNTVFYEEKEPEYISDYNKGILKYVKHKDEKLTEKQLIAILKYNVSAIICDGVEYSFNDILNSKNELTYDVLNYLFEVGNLNNEIIKNGLNIYSRILRKAAAKKRNGGDK